MNLNTYFCDKHAPPEITGVPAVPVVPNRAPNMRHLALWPQDVTMVVAHSPCPDGFAAAYAAFTFNPRLKFALVNHDQLALLGDRVAGERVLFLDIAPKAAVLAGWRMEAYAILDHHKTAEADLARVPEANKVFDMTRSGCALAWQYFYPDTPMPRVFEAVEARDLWQKDRFPGCDIMIAPLADRMCFECWRYYVARPDELIGTGMKLEEERLLKVDAYVRTAVPGAITDTSNDTVLRAWLIEVPDPACISDVGHRVLALKATPDGFDVDRTHDVAILYRDDAKTGDRIFSLRSLPDGPDVGDLCAKRGGGGHRNAAGFTRKAGMYMGIQRRGPDDK